MLSTAATLPPIDLSQPLPLIPPHDADAAAGPDVRCANYQAHHVGNYCAECGAPRLDSRPVTVRRFVRDAWNDLTSLVSATTLTVRALLTRPGELRGRISTAGRVGTSRRHRPPLASQ